MTRFEPLSEMALGDIHRVAPTAEQPVIPFGAIERGAVEFIAPNEVIAGGGSAMALKDKNSSDGNAVRSSRESSRLRILDEGVLLMAKLSIAYQKTLSERVGGSYYSKE